MARVSKLKEPQLVASICPYCGCGCVLYVRTEDGVAKNIEYLEEHPVTEGAPCPKGNAALQVVYHPERLRYPMKKHNEDWVRVSWEEALDLIATQFRRIKEAPRC